MRFAHDLPFGARLSASGVAFRLWAPAARSVELSLTAHGGTAAGSPTLLPATRDAAGWWRCDAAEATAGTRYQWRIDGELSVPDPASRHNPEGPHGPSVVVDPQAYDWRHPWSGRPWAEVVLYEMHVGTFTEEGTYAAAARRLPALRALGITAVELMPVATFGGRFGWGYDGVLPYAPHPAYGPPEALKAFIDEAHGLGLMVFLDVVYNHFGPDGNYLARYAPDFFSRSKTSPWGPAINFDGEGSQPVRDFFIQNAVYWVQEYRFDGLRLDAVHAISDESASHVLQELSSAVRDAAAGRHVHLVLENEHNHYHHLATGPERGRYDAQWNDDFHHALHVAMTGETQGYYHDYGTQPLELLGRSLTHGMLFEASPRKPGGAREQVRAAPAQPLQTLVNFAHNHDQVGNRARGERLSQLVPAEAAPLATLLALLTPAIPMLFLGEESGSPQPFLYFADWEGELREAVRAGRKREFGHVGGDELPDPCSEHTFHASRPDPRQAQSAEGQAWQAMVRRALEARARHITPRQDRLLAGRHTHRRVGERGLLAQWRYGDGRMLQLELNLGAEPIAVESVRQGVDGCELVFSHGWSDATADARGSAWPAWSARWTLGQEAAA